MDAVHFVRAIGSDLVVCVGKPDEQIPAVMRSAGMSGKFTMYAQSEVTSEEMRTEKRMRSAIQV